MSCREVQRENRRESEFFLRVRRAGKISLEFGRLVAIRIGVRRVLAFMGNGRPRRRKFRIDRQPFISQRISIWHDCRHWALGRTGATVDAFVGADDKHYFTAKKAIDRTDLDAIGIEASDACIGNYKRHSFTPRDVTRLSVRDVRRRK